MPFRESTPMDQRAQAVAEYYRNKLTGDEIAARFNISRKTLYKWVDRFEACGTAGLVDRPRRPHYSPLATSEDLVSRILELHDRTGRGAKKLRAILTTAHPSLPWPSETTFSAILNRNGRVKQAKRRRRLPHPGPPTFDIDGPNDVWSADHKGEFRTRDGIYCYPLTITDNFSRYILACTGLLSTSIADAKPVFINVFREFGLPHCIRTDNGGPFSSPVALGRMTRLSAWWVRLGIYPELIEPGCPQQNGRHERMHRTLKAETTIPPAATRRAQQRKFNTFVADFNDFRPHEALGQTTPASHFSPSPRRYPERLPHPEYPAHFEVRRVSNNGGIRWQSNWVNVSRVLEQEYIGLEQVDNEIWDVYFGALWIGQFHEQSMRIVDEKGRHFRTKKCLKL